MGNFEKLSVLVIVVIIVMILAVAVVEWTSDTTEAPTEGDLTATALLSPPSDPLPEPRGSGDRKDASKPQGTSLSAKDSKESGKDGSKGSSDPLEDWLRVIGEGKKDAREPGPVEPPKPDDKAKKEETKPVAPAPGDVAETTHVVAQGETLGEIAKKYYGRSSLYTAILEANPGITPTTLRPKQTLKIPPMKGVAPGASTPPGMAASLGGPGERPVPGKEYKVRAGDTWQKISLAAFGTEQRWPEIYLKNINRVRDQKDLAQGKVIVIPAK